MSKQLKAAKAASSSKANPLEAIPQLEKACTGSTFNPNSLIPLLVLSRHADPEVVYKAVWALHRVFIKYISDNRVGGIVDSPSRTRGGAEEETEDGVNEGSVKGWVRDRLFEYVEVLGGLLRDTEDALRVRIQRSMRVKLTLVYRLAAAVLPTRSTVILRVQR
jgi:U3 small nucleolar RNA-associated protein 19